MRFCILFTLMDNGLRQTLPPEPGEEDHELLDPLELLAEAIEYRGGTLLTANYALGDYDGVAIVEFETPDDVGAVVLALSAQRLLCTTTLTLLPRQRRYTGILRAAHDLAGHLRGGHLRGGHLRGGHLRGGHGGG